MISVYRFSTKLKKTKYLIYNITEIIMSLLSDFRIHADNVDQVLEDWRDYKLAVPTYGAIILNQDLTKVLLVQGYWSRTSWGFPKGKVNEDEAPHLCAVREVYEETGYDIAQRINPKDYLSQVINDQTSWLYLIHGVPDDTKFSPKTKKEIRDIKWFPIASLPASKKEEMPPTNDPRNPLNLTHNNLYMVIPFVRGLRKWLAGRQKASKMGESRSHTASMSNQGGGRGSRQSHNKSRQRRSASRSESFSSDSNSQQQPQDLGLTDNFVPKAWAHFRINRNEIVNAIETTPGWIK